MTTSSVEELKQQGNKAFSSGNYQDAIGFFSKAIDLDPSNHVLFSNRSAAYSSLRDYEKALQDADKAINISPNWAKVFQFTLIQYNSIFQMTNARVYRDTDAKVQLCSDWENWTRQKKSM